MFDNALLDFHPAARDAINRRAGDLLGEVAEHAIKPNAPPAFPSERPVAAHITDKEMIGEPSLFEIDIFGNTVARYFHRDHEVYGLVGDAYQDLRRTADQLLKTRWVRQSLGRAYVEDHLFLWCRDSFGNASAQIFTDYLLEQAKKDLRKIPVWIPVAFMEVEQEFQFGFAKLSPMTAALFDEHEKTYAEKSPANAEAIHSLFSKKRNKFQGLAAIVLELEGVGGYVMQRAVELATDIVGLLRLYSSAALVPWLVCPSAIAGTEYVPSTSAISYGHDGAFRMTEGMLKPLPYSWQISTNQWAEMKVRHLDTLSELIEEDGLSDLKKRLRTSILTFSKGTTMREPADRLVYSLSALEGLLLRDSSEAIQQNLGERLAFMLHNDSAQRQATVRALRDAYQLRSRYVHHQQSIEDEEALQAFFPIATSALFSALANAANFQTPTEFIDAIDRIKFGG